MFYNNLFKDSKEKDFEKRYLSGVEILVSLQLFVFFHTIYIYITRRPTSQEVFFGSQMTYQPLIVVENLKKPFKKSVH